MEQTIVLYPFPIVGHLVSMVELGKLILNHHPSFSITILIASSPYDTASTASNHVHRVCASAPSITFHHLPAIPLPLALLPENILSELPRLNNPHVQRSLQTISQTSSKPKAFVIDSFCYAAAEAAAELNIPTYYFFTSGASDLATFLYLPTLHENTTISLKDLVAHLEVPGVPRILTSDMPNEWSDRNSEVYKYFMNIAIHLSKSRGIIVNSFEMLEPRAVEAVSRGSCVPNAPTPPIFCIGPLIAPNHDHEHECMSWLSSQPSRSVVFLCFGSKGMFSAPQLKAMAEGLENSGLRFLWVVRNPAAEDKSETDVIHLWPHGFLDRTKDRGLVVKNWAPQVRVLSHNSVGGFVTHCGWNSILEAVCGGVPMVAWPLYAEQRLNRVFLVEEMKVAVAVDKSEDGFVSADELEKRVRELMDSEKGKAIRDRVMDMSREAVVAMGENGSSRAALSELAELWKRG